MFCVFSLVDMVALTLRNAKKYDRGDLNITEPHTKNQEPISSIACDSRLDHGHSILRKKLNTGSNQDEQQEDMYKGFTSQSVEFNMIMFGDLCETMINDRQPKRSNGQG